MHVTDFNYHLPTELIAHYPQPERSASRLLCLNRFTGEIQHKHFSDLLTLLKPHDLLVFNDTRVIPARLHGYKASGGKVEILIEKILSTHTVTAHVRASKKLVPGTIINLTNHYKAEIGQREAELFNVRFLTDQPVLDLLAEIGHIPLPPYVKRIDEPLDHERYQTVYAKHAGAIAAPTAGLHFDMPMLERLTQHGVNMAFITLHVGAGTFQPIRTARVEEHTMHSEQVTVSTETCARIQATQAQGGRIIAVGTTVVRSLETAARSGTLQPFCGETTIFIYPGYQFRCLDGLITNFHLPASSLLMLVSAYAGYATIMQAYQAAIQANYRFFSYGDAMFILPQHKTD